MLIVQVSAPRTRRVKIHTDQSWLRNLRVRGVVIGRRVFFADPGKSVPPWLLRHELEHVYQQIRLGVFRFYLKYFWYSLTRGYKQNPFELEAYGRQTIPLSHSEEQLLCKLRES